ncbi:hypothetical protein [Priestia megaterium]|uniref:hypothetical protein n=1 Tax=Priestia megaterium TaxID=1404 RepID=UPI00366E5169
MRSEKIRHELCKAEGGDSNKTYVEIFVEDEQIIIQKYRIDGECAVTGEISNNNKVYEGNIVLNPEGIKRLCSQLHAEILNKG